MGAGRQPWRKCGVECAGAVFAAGSARGGTKGARPRRSGECGCTGRPAERYGRSRSPLPGWRGAALGSPRGAEGARVGADRAAVPLTASSRRRGPRGRAVGGAGPGRCLRVREGLRAGGPVRRAVPSGGGTSRSSWRRRAGKRGRAAARYLCAMPKGSVRVRPRSVRAVLSAVSASGSRLGVEWLRGAGRAPKVLNVRAAQTRVSCRGPLTRRPCEVRPFGERTPLFPESLLFSKLVNF